MPVDCAESSSIPANSSHQKNRSDAWVANRGIALAQLQLLLLHQHGEADQVLCPLPAWRAGNIAHNLQINTQFLKLA